MLALDRICAVVAAPSAADAERQLRAAVGEFSSRTVELRLDYLRNAAERAALLAALPRHRRGVTLIATCRSREGGGKFAGTAEEELSVLRQAAGAGCAWCDVELELAEDGDPRELRQALFPARLLVSAHDFRRTPRDLAALARRLELCGADAIKLAAVCASLADVRRLLALTRRPGPVVVVPMGPEALAARLLALREGSALAYAPVEQETAPGQISLREMHETYRLNRRFGTRASVSGPTRRTRLYGVIGDPIAHSLSPLMHNAAFAARRADALLVPFRVPPGPRGLREFLAAAVQFGISGFAVTLPHKQAILRHLDACHPLAAKIGAVNTVVVRKDGRLYGYNTDYLGVLRAIERRMPLRASRVLLVGAGGAARAAAFALAHAGAQVVICARRPARARELARAVGGAAVDRAVLRRESFAAIVNCTPVGLHPGSGSPLGAGELNCRLVMDLIYRPRRTKLLALAERRGITTVSGVDMFVAQGAAQWEIWKLPSAPETVMRRAVNRALDAEEGREEKTPAKILTEMTAKLRTARTRL